MNIYKNLKPDADKLYEILQQPGYEDALERMSRHGQTLFDDGMFKWLIDQPKHDAIRALEAGRSSSGWLIVVMLCHHRIEIGNVPFGTTVYLRRDTSMDGIRGDLAGLFTKVESEQLPGTLKYRGLAWRNTNGNVRVDFGEVDGRQTYYWFSPYEIFLTPIAEAAERS